MVTCTQLPRIVACLEIPRPLIKAIVIENVVKGIDNVKGVGNQGIMVDWIDVGLIDIKIKLKLEIRTTVRTIVNRAKTKASITEGRMSVVTMRGGEFRTRYAIRVVPAKRRTVGGLWIGNRRK